MPEIPAKPARVPPRWFVRTFWSAHRGLYRLTRGRLGLWRPKPGRWGAMRLTTIGRRSGIERSVILGYFEDGPNLVTMAMNGWSSGEPAWWLNLQGPPRGAGEPGRRRPRRQGESRGGRGASPPLGAVARTRRQSGRLCGTAFHRDRGRDPRAARRRLRSLGPGSGPRTPRSAARSGTSPTGEETRVSESLPPNRATRGGGSSHGGRTGLLAGFVAQVVD